jgi:hypothetical protein
VADRARRGPRDGNDRIARIARFLAEPRQTIPDGCTLVLLCSAPNGDPDVVSGWEPSLVTPDLAHEINALITDYANDMGTTCNATVAWRRADESIWRSKPFRAVCDTEDRENVQALDSTVTSQITQLQRHCEANAQLISQMVDRSGAMGQRNDERFERMLGHYERMIDSLMERLNVAETQRTLALEERDNSLELAAQASDAAEAANERADNAGKGDPLGQVIEIASRQLMGADHK